MYLTWPVFLFYRQLLPARWAIIIKSENNFDFNTFLSLPLRQKIVTELNVCSKLLFLLNSIFFSIRLFGQYTYNGLVQQQCIYKIEVTNIYNVL